MVPREAVQEKDGKHLVWKKDAKGFSPWRSPGPAALGKVVIETGLKEKDVVALRDPGPEPLPGSKGEPAQNGGGGGGGGVVIIR